MSTTAIAADQTPAPPGSRGLMSVLKRHWVVIVVALVALLIGAAANDKTAQLTALQGRLTQARAGATKLAQTNDATDASLAQAQSDNSSLSA